MVGSSLIYVRPRTSRGVQLWGYFMLSVGPAIFSLQLGLYQANICGMTKRATFNAIVFLFYSAANIVGPHLFRASQAPTYNGAFCGIVVCYAVTGGMSVGLRMYLAHANAQREQQAAEQGSTAAQVSIRRTSQTSGPAQKVAAADRPEVNPPLRRRAEEDDDQAKTTPGWGCPPGAVAAEERHELDLDLPQVPSETPSMMTMKDRTDLEDRAFRYRL